MRLLQVKWDRQLYMEQLTCVSKAMAYAHKTSEQALVQLHRHNKDLHAHKIYSPLTFLEFFNLFNHTASMIRKRAEVSRACRVYVVAIYFHYQNVSA